MGTWETKNASRRLNFLEKKFDKNSNEFLWKLFCPIRHSLDNYVNAWPIYNNLIEDRNFVEGFLLSKIKLWQNDFPHHLLADDIFKQIIEHKGGVGKSPAFSHVTLGSAEHYEWGKVLGLKHITDGEDEMGRSLFHAACLLNNNTEAAVIVKILEDKNKNWSNESRPAMAAFMKNAFNNILDIENAKKAVSLIEKNSPLAIFGEYKSKTKEGKEVVHSVRIGLWYKLFYAQKFFQKGDKPSDQTIFLSDWLNEWDKKGNWSPSEKKFLIEGWDSVPNHFKEVMVTSKAHIEKDLLSVKVYHTSSPSEKCKGAL